MTLSHIERKSLTPKLDYVMQTFLKGMTL